MMAQLLKTGDLQTHIEKILNPAYQKRYEIMVNAIEQHLVPLSVRLGEVSFEGKDVFGGYFIWLELPSHVTATKVAERAKEKENLIVAPGHIFEVQGDDSVKFENSLRLCFSWEEEADLEEGIVRLTRIVKDVRNGESGETEGGKAVKQGVVQDLGEFK